MNGTEEAPYYVGGPRFARVVLSTFTPTLILGGPYLFNRTAQRLVNRLNAAFASRYQPRPSGAAALPPPRKP